MTRKSKDFGHIRVAAPGSQPHVYLYRKASTGPAVLDGCRAIFVTPLAGRLPECQGWRHAYPGFGRWTLGLVRRMVFAP